jgi:hypothetical protein
MESWRIVWRDGFVPGFTKKQLEALAEALRADDPRLIQGETVYPVLLPDTSNEIPLSACALGFCGWHGDGLRTVGDIKEFFARCCFEADNRLGEVAACRWFLNWFDDTPREVMRRELLAEVVLALKKLGHVEQQPVVALQIHEDDGELD